MEGKEMKPRTYRKQAQKEYLKVSKKRKPNNKMIVKGIKMQLKYLRRNLNQYREIEYEDTVTGPWNRVA